MPHIKFHPAPGLGELMNGWFNVPQNPIAPDYTELVPTPQAKAGGRPVYTAKLGELMPGKFVVPQNPIVRELASGLAGCGCGGGCNKGCGCPSAIGFSGLGDVADDAYIGLRNALDSMPSYVPWVIGGGLVLLLLSGRGKSYREDVSKVRARHPTRAARLRRMASSY